MAYEDMPQLPANMNEAELRAAYSERLFHLVRLGAKDVRQREADLRVFHRYIGQPSVLDLQDLSVGFNIVTDMISLQSDPSELDLETSLDASLTPLQRLRDKQARAFLLNFDTGKQLPGDIDEARAVLDMVGGRIGEIATRDFVGFSKTRLRRKQVLIERARWIVLGCSASEIAREQRVTHQAVTTYKDKLPQKVTQNLRRGESVSGILNDSIVVIAEIMSRPARHDGEFSEDI